MFVVDIVAVVEVELPVEDVGVVVRGIPVLEVRDVVRHLHWLMPHRVCLGDGGGVELRSDDRLRWMSGFIDNLVYF